MIEFRPFLLTVELALITTFVLFFVGVPIAYYLANTKSRLKPIFESVVALPLVLPPSVLGFYFLWVFIQYAHSSPFTAQDAVIAFG